MRGRWIACPLIVVAGLLIVAVTNPDELLKYRGLNGPIHLDAPAVMLTVGSVIVNPSHF